MPQIEATKPQTPREWEHVDHALEMWREGNAMGGGRGELGSYSAGYRFDGKVDAVGENDGGAPPTREEIEQAHDTIRGYISTRWDVFRKAFLALDEDRSGHVSKLEFLRILMMGNLPIREKVMSALAEMADTNKNGTVGTLARPAIKHYGLALRVAKWARG